MKSNNVSKTQQEILLDLHLLKNEENEALSKHEYKNMEKIDERSYEMSIQKTNRNDDGGSNNKNIKCTQPLLKFNIVPDLSTVEHIEDDKRSERQKEQNSNDAENIFSTPTKFQKDNEEKNLEGDESMNKENMQIMKNKESLLSLDKNSGGKVRKEKKVIAGGDFDGMDDCCDADSSGLSEIQ